MNAPPRVGKPSRSRVRLAGPQQRHRRRHRACRRSCLLLAHRGELAYLFDFGVVTAVEEGIAVTSLRALLASAGFHGQGLDTAVAVAMAESGGHPTSHNTNAGTGDNSYGLFQINMLGSLGPARMQQYHL